MPTLLPTGNPVYQHPSRVAAKLLFVALAYFACGRLGLAIPYVDSHITLVWLPTGIAVAALIRWGYICWPGIFIGALATNFSIDSSPLLDGSIALGNTLGPLLAAWLLRRLKFHGVLDRTYDILLLVVAAAIGMLVSASGGVNSLVIFKVLPIQDAGAAWLSWWAGDFVGVLLAAPLLLNISYAESKELWAQRVEFSVWFMTTLVIYWGLFYFSSNELSYSHQLAFVGLPTVVWAAMRFGVMGYSLGVLLPVFIAALATGRGLGPFYTEDVQQGLVQLWAFFFTLVLVELMVAAMQAGRKRAEVTLQQSELQLRAIIETEPECVKLMAQDGTVLQMNAAGLRMLEADTSEQIIGQKALGIVAPQYRDAFVSLMKRVFEGESGHLEFKAVGLKGAQRWLETDEVPMRDAQGKITAMLGITRDITDRKAKDAKILRMTNLYAALSQCNQAILHCTSEDELFPQICRDVVQFGGLKMAWIGLVDQESKRVNPVAAFGTGTEYLEGIQISVDAGDPHGRGPTGISIRENHPVWCQDFQHDPATALWRERGARVGWAASASLPLHRDDFPIGAFMVYATEVNAFDEPARNLLMEMVMDIDFALGNYALQAERNRAEETLRENEACTKLILDMAMDAVIGTDQEGMVINWNHEAERMFGYAAGEAIGKSLSELIVPQVDRKAHQKGMQHFVKTGKAKIIGKRIEITAMRADGSEFPIELTLSAIQRQGRYIFNAFVRDITERKQTEEAMRIASVTFETQEAILITDPEARILRVNQAFQDITSYSAEEVIGQNPRILQSGRHDADFYRAMWSALLSTGKWSGEIWGKRKNGDIYPKAMTITAVYDGARRVTHFVAVFRDISNRKKSEREIHQLAFYDPLTMLPNRRLMQDRLQRAQAVSARNSRYGALLFLDLDHFKTINDTQGHAMGDQLLIEQPCSKSSNIWVPRGIVFQHRVHDD